MRNFGSGVIAALIPLFTISFVSHIAPYIYIPSLPDIADSFGLDTTEAGGMMSAYYLAMSVTLLIVGSVGDIWDKKKMLGGASSLIFIGTMLASLSLIYGLVIGGWALQGVGAAAITIIGQTWIGQSSRKNNITRLYSYMAIALSFAPLVAPVVGGIITEEFSWRYNFYIVGILCLFSIIPVYKTTPPTPPGSTGTSVGNSFSVYMNLLFQSKFTAIIGTSLACFLFQGMLMAYSSFLFIDRLGLTAAAYGLISIPVVMGCIIGQFPVMYLEKNHGLTSAFLFNSVTAVAALAGSLLFYAITGSHTVLELALVILVFSIGFGGHTLLATRNIMTVFSSRRSHSSALMNFLDQFAGYVAAVSVQLLFALIGSAVMVHNFACGITITIIVATTIFYLGHIKNTELSNSPNKTTF